MKQHFRCGWRCTAACLTTFLLLLGMLLTGCQDVKDTSADVEAARQAEKTAVSPDLTRATDKDGNTGNVIAAGKITGLFKGK